MDQGEQASDREALATKEPWRRSDGCAGKVTESYLGLRALQLGRWKHGTTAFRELRKLGVSPTAAVQAAAGTRRWWHRAVMFVQLGLTTRYYDRVGVPRLAG